MVQQVQRVVLVVLEHIHLYQVLIQHMRVEVVVVLLVDQQMLLVV
jgi:hypothetical protein